MYIFCIFLWLRGSFYCWRGLVGFPFRSPLGRLVSKRLQFRAARRLYVGRYRKSSSCFRLFVFFFLLFLVLKYYFSDYDDVVDSLVAMCIFLDMFQSVKVFHPTELLLLVAVAAAAAAFGSSRR